MYEGFSDIISNYNKSRTGWWGGNKNKLEYDDFLDINKYIFEFEDDDRIKYESNPTSILSNSFNSKFILADNRSVKSDDGIDNWTYINFDVSDQNIFVYSPFVIINKTVLTIFFGEKGKKDEKIICVSPNQDEFFNPLSREKQKFSIKIDNYEWSEPFNITTVGIAGQVSLKRSSSTSISKNPEEANVVQQYNSNNLNFGVVITTWSNPYSRTKVISIVPRYVIVNNTKQTIIVAQDHHKAANQIRIGPKDKKTYHFEMKGSKNNFIKIREWGDNEYSVAKTIPYNEIPSENWSSKFSIDDLEDFQVSFSASIRTDEENVSDEDEDNANEEAKWNEPSYINGMRRYVRVIITSEDEASIFIILWDPNMPEYRINNLTNNEITIYQENTKDNRVLRTAKSAVIVVKPGGDRIFNSIPIPFVWDDQTIETKRVVLTWGDDRKKYDFDEIGDKKSFYINKQKFHVKVISTGYFRELQIITPVDHKEDK